MKDIFPEVESRYVDSELIATNSKKISELSRFFYSAFSFLLICAGIWIFCFYANKNLPDIRPGVDVINSAKTDYLKNHLIFSPNKPIKVLVFGDSKVLSGFIPKQFDHEVHGATSYNVGFGGTSIFIPQLQKLLCRGVIPTHVLVMVPWFDSPVEKKSFFHFLPRDEKIINVLFPFHLLIRNTLVFLLRSKQYGGPLGFYHYAEAEVENMYRDHGYFFIYDQSRFPNERLPKNFHLESDNSKLIKYRDPDINSKAFHKLKDLADQYKFKIIVMPYYLRQRERGQVGINYAMVNALKPYHEFSVMSKDYFLFHDHYFSDTEHLNPSGAKMYTEIIVNLMKNELANERKSHVI